MLFSFSSCAKKVPFIYIQRYCLDCSLFHSCHQSNKAYNIHDVALLLFSFVKPTQQLLHFRVENDDLRAQVHGEVHHQRPCGEGKVRDINPLMASLYIYLTCLCERTCAHKSLHVLLSFATFLFFSFFFFFCV